MVGSANRWALMHENCSGLEPSLEELVARMSSVDLLLVEGFKRDTLGKSLLCVDDPYIVAVASDVVLPQVRVPVFGLDDVPAIADFILSQVGLMGRVSHGAA